MPYFCVACGTFQREDDSRCAACGAKYEKATYVDLFSHVAKDVNESDSFDDLPDELVSRPRYFWYKTTRPWRKLWRRGFLWRIFLLAGAFLVVGLPLATATIQIIKQRCNPQLDITCEATVVRLVTPVSEEFFNRLTEPMNDNEIALSAEIYDAVMLLGLAMVDDKMVSPREVIRISGGDLNICSPTKLCATEIQKGQDVDYDGVSGSVFLSPDGDRGTYLTNRLTHEKTNAIAENNDRLIGSLKSRWLDPDTTFSSSTISVISRSDGRSVSQAVMLATNDLQDAGVKVQVIHEFSRLDNIDRLGNLLVIVDWGYSDELIDRVVASNRLIIAVGSEWRKINTNSKILRISANPNLLAAAVASELKTTGEILVVGRCGDQSPALASSLARLRRSNKMIRLVRTDCMITRPTNFGSSVSKSSIETLVIATSYNPIGLYKTLLETGYIGKTKNIILIGERIIRIPVSDSPSPNP